MVMHSMVIGGLLFGVGGGWRPLPDGEGMEYLIQLSPADVEAMKVGEPWMTQIPASLGDIRAYRITIGTGDLPREAPPPSLPPVEEAAAQQPGPPHLEPVPAAQPMPERQALYVTPDPAEGEPADENESFPADAASSADAAHPRPWMLLVGTALALAGSLGGNAYLFWGIREAHRRYRDLAARCPDAARA